MSPNFLVPQTNCPPRDAEYSSNLLLENTLTLSRPRVGSPDRRPPVLYWKPEQQQSSTFRSAHRRRWSSPLTEPRVKGLVRKRHLPGPTNALEAAKAKGLHQVNRAIA